MLLWEDAMSKSYYKCRIHYILGREYQKEGITDKALKHFQTVITSTAWCSDDDLVNSRIGIGLIYASLGLFEAAIDEYLIALRIDPNSASVLNDLGNAFDNKGVSDTAISYYQKAISLNPNYADAHYNIGVALERKGSLDEAVEHYKIALEIKPAFTSARSKLNAVYENNREYYARRQKLPPRAATY